MKNKTKELLGRAVDDLELLMDDMDTTNEESARLFPLIKNASDFIQNAILAENKVSEKIKDWVIDWDNDVKCGYVEWWTVSSESRDITYRADSEKDARCLCDLLNKEK